MTNRVPKAWSALVLVFIIVAAAIEVVVQMVRARKVVALVTSGQ